jgi:hypothetical protein
MDWCTPMKKLFFQLGKVDFQGMATGIAAAEEVDHDNEVLDYFGSKPYFQAWSDVQMAASKGKSKGNLRLQHDPKTCIGKLTDLTFDDANKCIRVSVKVVDPVAKELLREGVLTGFSIGGEYIKKTPMSNGTVRYIAGPSELSVVDKPCAPSALFEHVKADGSSELRKFAKHVRPVEYAILEMVKYGFMDDAMICQALGTTAGEISKVRKKFKAYNCS